MARKRERVAEEAFSVTYEPMFSEMQCRLAPPGMLLGHDSAVEMEITRPGWFDLDWRAPKLPPQETEKP